MGCTVDVIIEAEKEDNFNSLKLGKGLSLRKSFEGKIM